jgi:osmoprotectant transport system ATP-binding protein
MLFAMISLRNITVAYNEHETIALNNVSLEISRTSTTVLLGQSGSGKSTILRLVAGLIFPTKGSIYCDNVEITQHNITSMRKRIGYAIQSGGLFPHLTAQENISLAAQHGGWEKETMEQRITELAELTSLSKDMLHRYPSDLSGGQQQRVSLMRALMMKPDILLLDEPLSALDPIIRADLQQDLRKIFAELTMTVVFVTHDIHEAHYIGNHIVLLEHGSIVQQAASIQELREQPATAFVQRFVEAQSQR